MPRIRHEICPRHCEIEEGQVGVCGVWRNVDGVMIDLAHEWVAVPLIGLSSGSIEANINEGFEGYCLEIHLAGCNLRCDFCSQKFLSRANISEFDGIRWKHMSAEEVVLTAVQGGAQTIMISGGEPTIHPDYVSEIGREARLYGLKTRVLTNGFISDYALEKFISNVDSIVVGVKGSLNHNVYRKMNPDMVLDTLKKIYDSNVHLAISSLVDPSFNDSIEDAGKLAKWIAEKLSPNIPVLFCFRTMSKSNLFEFVGEKQGTPFWHDKEATRKWIVERSLKAKECGLKNLMYFDPIDELFLKKV